MTRTDAIASAAAAVAQADRILYGLDGHTVQQAAEQAWTPTGPSLDELIDRIRQQREQALAA